MSIVGLSYMIIYLNLLALGFTIEDYLIYISKRVECLLFIPGYLMVVVITFKRRKK